MFPFWKLIGGTLSHQSLTHKDTATRVCSKSMVLKDLLWWLAEGKLPFPHLLSSLVQNLNGLIQAKQKYYDSYKHRK